MIQNHKAHLSIFRKLFETIIFFKILKLIEISLYILKQLLLTFKSILFRAANYGEITLQPSSANLIDALQPTINQQNCVSDTLPKSFEDIDQPYGFVLYSTVILQDGDLLDCSKAKDVVYVFVNKEFKGMLLASINLFQNLTAHIGAKAGDQLDLIVENRGRQNYPAVVDKKVSLILDNIKIEK